MHFIFGSHSTWNQKPADQFHLQLEGCGLGSGWGGSDGELGECSAGETKMLIEQVHSEQSLPPLERLV